MTQHWVLVRAYCSDRQDGLDIRTRIELNDKEYRIKPLGRQGRFSETYNIIGGFVKDGATVPAVLKVTEGGRDSWKAEKEISYLQTASRKSHFVIATPS